MTHVFKKLGLVAVIAAGLCISPWQLSVGPGGALQLRSVEAFAGEGGSESVDRGTNDSDNDVEPSSVGTVDSCGASVGVTAIGRGAANAVAMALLARDVDVQSSAALGAKIGHAIDIATRDGTDPVVAANNAAREGLVELVARGMIHDPNIDAVVQGAIVDGMGAGAQQAKNGEDRG
jgi:hypothetical protein